MLILIRTALVLCYYIHAQLVELCYLIFLVVVPEIYVYLIDTHSMHL